jgi:hypothetical protein
MRRESSGALTVLRLPINDPGISNHVHVQIQEMQILCDTFCDDDLSGEWTRLTKDSRLMS